MYTDLTFSPHTSFGMGTKLALNFIWNGIKKVLKSLEFHLEDPGGTLTINPWCLKTTVCIWKHTTGNDFCVRLSDVCACLISSSVISLTGSLPISRASGKCSSSPGSSMWACCSSFFGFSSTFKHSSFKTRFYQPSQWRRLNSTVPEMCVESSGPAFVVWDQCLSIYTVVFVQFKCTREELPPGCSLVFLVL